MAGGVGEMLPEALSSVACNCKRMNVINYIFSKKISQEGRGQSWSQAPAVEVAGDYLSDLGREGCWVSRRRRFVSTLPPVLLDSSQAHSVLRDYMGFHDFYFKFIWYLLAEFSQET